MRVPQYQAWNGFFLYDLRDLPIYDINNDKTFLVQGNSNGGAMGYLHSSEIKAIRQGDIVQFYLSNNFGPVTHAVEFKDGGFRVSTYDLSYVGRKKVIGNIYEHPELLRSQA